MSGATDRRARLEELLLDRAAFGLEGAEARELEGLLAAFPDVDAEAWERTAAVLHLALLPPAPDEPGPALRACLERQAAAFVAGTSVTPLAPVAPVASVASVASSGARPAAAAPPARIAAWSGWLAALAAGVLALLALQREGRGSGELTPAALRAELLARGLVAVPWAGTEDPLGVGLAGDVVWSDGEQRGCLRFVGLAPNDPREAQYQLWIFDAGRDAERPVDGGVFDVAGAGEVLVPIDAKLRVGEARAFAVTLERPGGVVVSERDRLLCLAQRLP